MNKFSNEQKLSFLEELKRLQQEYEEEGFGFNSDDVFNPSKMICEYFYDMDLKKSDMEIIDKGKFKIDADGYPSLDYEVIIDELEVRFILNICHDSTWNYFIKEILDYNAYKEREEQSLDSNLREDVRHAILALVSNDYYSLISEVIFEEIVEDVKETSAYNEGYYNIDDIRLSAGRVICKKLNI